MAQITITIPDNVVQRVLDAFAIEYGYAGLPDPKPTKAAFAKSMLIKHIRDITLHREREVAARAAEQAASSIDTIT